jgi:uncharacterized protein (UPF0332 family)
MDQARITLARQFLDDAQHLLGQGRLRSATSRAYYAAYHAAVVLFEEYGYKPNSFIGKGGRPALVWEHSIVTARFFHEFVQQRKLFPWQAGQEIRRLYARRVAADYDHSAVLAEADVQMLVASARSIVVEVERRV